ncbi:MAG TPA: alpha/beta fold hydrolase [Acidimicrobiales bacterium]|nr:alpha/beta fold hydrolase [Acidimicrobiales bacterium]
MSASFDHRVPVDVDTALAVDLWPAETGSAAAFLLVHGLASNAQLWWESAAHLSELGHPVATVDQRGHGRSDKPAEGYTLDQACEDLLSVVAHLRGSVPGFDRRLIVAGQSWGANVALELGYRHPDVFSAVVCVDGGTIELAARFPDWESCAAALAPPRTKGRRAADIEAFMNQAHATWPASGITAQMANFEVMADGTVAPRLSFENHMTLLRALWGHHPSTRYAGMKVPVLMVPADSGQASWTADKRKSVDEALAALPRGKAHWFSPADHDIHAQFPVELADVLHVEATEGLLA